MTEIQRRNNEDFAGVEGQLKLPEISSLRTYRWRCLPCNDEESAREWRRFCWVGRLLKLPKSRHCEACRGRCCKKMAVDGKPKQT